MCTWSLTTGLQARDWRGHQANLARCDCASPDGVVSMRISPSRTAIGLRWCSARASAAGATLKCSLLADHRNTSLRVCLSLCAPSPLAVLVGVLELERASSSLSIEMPLGLRITNLSCEPRAPGPMFRWLRIIPAAAARRHPTWSPSPRFGATLNVRREPKGKLNRNTRLTYRRVSIAYHCRNRSFRVCSFPLRLKSVKFRA